MSAPNSEFLKTIAQSLAERAMKTVEAGLEFNPVFVFVRDETVFEHALISRPLHDGPFTGRLYTEVGQRLGLSDKQEALMRIAFFMATLQADAVSAVMQAQGGAPDSEVRPSEDPAAYEAVLTLEATSAGLVRLVIRPYGRQDDGRIHFTREPQETLEDRWTTPGDWMRFLRFGLDPSIRNRIYPEEMKEITVDSQMKFLSRRGFTFLPIVEDTRSFMNGDPDENAVGIEDEKVERDKDGGETVTARVNYRGALSLHEVHVVPARDRAEVRRCKRLFLSQPTVVEDRDVRSDGSACFVARRTERGSTTYFLVMSDWEPDLTAEVHTRNYLAEYAAAKWCSQRSECDEAADEGDTG